MNAALLGRSALRLPTLVIPAHRQIYGKVKTIAAPDPMPPGHRVNSDLRRIAASNASLCLQLTSQRRQQPEQDRRKQSGTEKPSGCGVPHSRTEEGRRTKAAHVAKGNPRLSSTMGKRSSSRPHISTAPGPQRRRQVRIRLDSIRQSCLGMDRNIHIGCKPASDLLTW